MASILDQPRAFPTDENTMASVSDHNASTCKSRENGESPMKAQQPEASAAAAEEKLSPKELKKRKQAEKAAKRAQAKQNTETVTQGESKSSKASESPNMARKAAPPGTPTVAAQKTQHKRTGSMSQKSLPARPVQIAEKTNASAQAIPTKKVAVFGHLYGQPRRSTIAGASKDVHPAVLALGLQMSSYVVCGSSARCIAMLLAFKRVIESYSTPPGNSLPRHLVSLLSPQIEYLISCRPLSTSMGNSIRWLKLEINDVDIETPESKAKADLCEAIDGFIREKITAADQIISSSAAGKIRDGDVILTFARSNVVIKALLEAHRKGRSFSVVVVDSRPLFEGKTTAKILTDAGISVRYSLTHAIGHLSKSATKVFLGAHSMLSNGRLYSRLGTAMVAMTAKADDVPVIVCCESIKFTDKVALDSIVTNELSPPDELLLQGHQVTSLASWRDCANLQLLNLMYDVTPADYISMVITEYGSLPPTSVPAVHRLSTNT